MAAIDFVQKARTAGYSDQEIETFLIKKQTGKEPNFLQKLVMERSLPLNVGVGTGILASLTGIGAPLAIPGAGAAAGATYALQDLLRGFVGVPDVRSGQQKLTEAGGEFLKSAGSEAGGRVLGFAAGKLAPPLIRKLPIGKEKMAKMVGSELTGVGRKINELLTPFENKPINPKVIGEITTELDEMAASQGFKWNPQAVQFINDVRDTVISNSTIGPAHGLRTEFGPTVLSKTGIEKYASTLPKSALQTSKQIVAPLLKKGIEEVRPGYSDLLGQYSNLKRLQTGISQPMRITPASIMGILTGAVAGPRAVPPIVSGTLIATNPYLSLLARKSLGGVR